jgi:5-methylphenazine-1-carboxylate 1-monooxygenase
VQASAALTAALTLHARGISLTVIERAHELRALGAGINLLPHAVRELYELGFGDDLAENAVAPAAISYCDTDGKLLFREPRGIHGGYGYPQYSVHRGRLQMLLLSAVRDRLGPDAVRTGAQLMGFTQHDDHVQVHTAAGDFVAAVLVGADGVHSSVRAQLHPDDDPLLWSGVRMFRGAADCEPLPDGRTMAIVKDAAGIDLVTYPIGVISSTGGWAGWTPQIWCAKPTRCWSIRWPIATCCRGGDAAASRCSATRRIRCIPLGANGGSQAVVDARVLAEELARDFRGGLRRYEDTRRTEPPK